jgi:hypothetical protein
VRHEAFPLSKSDPATLSGDDACPQLRVLACDSIHISGNSHQETQRAGEPMVIFAPLKNLYANLLIDARRTQNVARISNALIRRTQKLALPLPPSKLHNLKVVVGVHVLIFQASFNEDESRAFSSRLPDLFEIVSLIIP